MPPLHDAMMPLMVAAVTLLTEIVAMAAWPGKVDAGATLK
jgi:hypothetical protein